MVASILGDMEKAARPRVKQIVGDVARAQARHRRAPNLRYAYAHLQTYEAAVRGGA